MRTFNPNANYLVSVVGQSKETVRKFKTENALTIYGRTLANKKKCAVYIVECQNCKNAWHFFK